MADNINTKTTKPAVTAEFIQRGNNINYTAVDGAEYMQVVPLAARIGVALENIPAGGTGTVTLTGAFKLPAASGELATGAQVYWDAAAGKVTATAAGNVPAGYVIEPKLSAGTTAIVRIG